MDSVGQLAWVPEAHRAHGKGPGQLNTFGSAVLAMAIPGTARAGPDHVPAHGLGTLVQNVEGHWNVICWPAQSILDRGASLASTRDFLDSLSHEEFTSWAKENAQYAQLPEGAAFWVPYGWHVRPMATYSNRRSREEEEDVASALLMQPYLSVSMASETDNIEASVVSLLDFLKECQHCAAADKKFAEANATRLQHVPALMDWLQVLLAEKVRPALADS